MRAAKRESNVMIESQIFLTPAKGTRVVVPLKDPMSHGCGYVARRLVTDLTDEPFGHKILLNLTFNYRVSTKFLQNINIHGIEIPATPFVGSPTQNVAWSVAIGRYRRVVAM